MIQESLVGLLAKRCSCHFSFNLYVSKNFFKFTKLFTDTKHMQFFGKNINLLKDQTV
jgi:hypothetical protein